MKNGGVMRHMRRLTWLFSVVLTLATARVLMVAPPAHAQATVGTGSIRGTVLDPGGNSVPSAKVTITSRDTARKITPDVTSSGEFNSGPVTPGQYTVRIEASGFKTFEQGFAVQVGQITAANFTLEIGSPSTMITVEATTVQVNTDQTSVQGVLTQDQIEN